MLTRLVETTDNRRALRGRTFSKTSSSARATTAHRTAILLELWWVDGGQLLQTDDGFSYERVSLRATKQLPRPAPHEK